MAIINSSLVAGRNKLHELSQNLYVQVTQSIRINVHRNTGFEFLQNPISTYLANYGLAPAFTVSDYADTLNQFATSADLTLIFYDFARIDFEVFELVLENFLRGLNQGSKVTLVSQNATTHASRILSKDARFTYIAIESISGLAEPISLSDPELLKYSASTLNPANFSIISKELAFNGIAKHFINDTRVIFVDFDETLYSGILGEDGEANLSQNMIQRNLVKFLINYSKSGGIVVGITKNDQSDIDSFLLKGTFDLNEIGFFDVIASWNEKSFAIKDTLARLNLHESNALFIDDNPAEILKISKILPEMILWHFTRLEDADFISILIPSVSRFEDVSKSTINRVADLKAKMLRSKISESGVALDDILQTEISATVNDLNNLQRAFELSVKTNQFNLLLRRRKFEEFLDAIADSNFSFALISLRDTLSDSGQIGLLSGRRENDSFIVDDFAISCRALGRDLENAFFQSAINEMLKEMPEVKSIVIGFKKGERNIPAQNWFCKYTTNLTETVRLASAEFIDSNIPKGLSNDK